MYRCRNFSVICLYNKYRMVMVIYHTNDRGGDLHKIDEASPLARDLSHGTLIGWVWVAAGFILAVGSTDFDWVTRKTANWNTFSIRIQSLLHALS